MSSASFPPLAEALTWEDPGLVEVVATTAYRSHLTFVASFASRVAKQHPDGQNVMKQLSALPNEKIEDLLASSETCFHLYAALNGDSGAWREFVIAVANQPTAPQRPFRVGRGRSLDIEVRGAAAHRALRASEFRPAYGPVVPFDPIEAERVTQRIRSAEADLNSLFPVQFGFVTRLVRTVVPRQDALIPGFKGSSNQTEIGRINLFNAHLPGLTSVPIVTSIVHEAIHNLLYIQEHEAPVVIDMETALHSRIRSPWSGKQVNLRALIHATFVWYGVSFMWSSSRFNRDTLDSDDVAYFRAFCSRGFDGDLIGRVLEPWSTAVRPDVWEQLAGLSSRYSVGQVRAN